MTFLGTPLGGLSKRERIDGSWRGEGLAILAWALGRFDLPPYDVQVDPYVVAEVIGFGEPATNTVLAAPSLRAAEELTSMADDLFSLHWRLREYSLVGKPIDFKAVAQRFRFPVPIAHLRFMDGDLELRGASISRAPEAVWREVMSIARERQQAANWLIGEEEIYSEVTCDT